MSEAARTAPSDASASGVRADRLSPEEIEFMRENLMLDAKSSSVRGPVRPTPVALIAEDRGLERARPRARSLFERWIPRLERVLISTTGLRTAAEITGVELSHPRPHLEGLGQCWSRTLRVVPLDREVLVSMGGPFIERVASRLLGAPVDSVSGRAPSAALLRIFGRVGELLVQHLVEGWPAERPGQRLVDDPTRRSTLASRTRPLVVVRLELRGECEGWISIATEGELFAESSEEEATVGRTGASRPGPRPTAILSRVPVELCVELGHARLSMTRARALHEGDLVALDRLVRDGLEIRVGGQLVALGRPAVDGTDMVVEITEVCLPPYEET